MSDIEIEIDGKKCQAKPNAMVIQVADEAGIYIPRFCYHKHLSIAANCRMCLVEVEKSPKTLPACATPVTPGMKVFTKSPKALAAQKAVMEFLLINHPLDCPICDQGGECELQDLAIGYGSANSEYLEGKRAVADKDIGPLIETAMTRCIHCTRCVRFGAEIAGMRELGATGRGEHMEIGTYIEHAMKSEVSGNVIDICPVGALTSKPFLFTARAWELQQFPTISSHDCLGSNIYAHTRNGEVMRVVPHENASINETWISDRDRFSYEALYHPDRLKNPLIKIDGKWKEVEWSIALEFAVKGLQKVLEKNGPEQIAALASPNSTLEEFYLLQKLMRTLGTSNVDHRLRQIDFSDQANTEIFTEINFHISELQHCDAILLVGSNIQKEQPIAGLHVRKATLNNAKVMAINLVDYPFNFVLSQKSIVATDEMVLRLAGIAKAMIATTDSAIENMETILADVVSEDSDVAMAQYLLTGEKACVVLGNIACNHPQAAVIRALSHLIAKLSSAEIALLTEGANATGAWLVGAVPNRTNRLSEGLDAQAMFQKKLKAYLLMNVEASVDCANPVVVLDALKAAEFVVSLSLFNHADLQDHADVILPITPFTETSGTFVNAAGVWQMFKGVATPFASARPAWKVLRVLGNLLHCEGFDFNSSEEVQAEIKLKLSESVLLKKVPYQLSEEHFVKPSKEKLFRVGGIPIYSVDSMVRRAKALQAAQPVIEGDVEQVRIHPKTAERLLLKEGMMVVVKQKIGEVSLPVAYDANLPERSVFIAGGILASAGLSELFGEVEIKAL